MSRRARAILATACGAHFVHDGFSDILYILLPVWAAEFGLTLRAGGPAQDASTPAGWRAFQVPAGILAERRGEARLLAAGTAVTALGFLAAGLTGGFLPSWSASRVGGLGSGCQHPLSSSLVSKAYETGPRRTALGTYNFSGDLGKVAVPAAVALALPGSAGDARSEVYARARPRWRPSSSSPCSPASAPAAPDPRMEAAAGPGLSGWGIRDPRLTRRCPRSTSSTTRRAPASSPSCPSC